MGCAELQYVDIMIHKIMRNNCTALFQVTQNFAPVLNVKVVATIELPHKSTEKLELFDKGSGIIKYAFLLLLKRFFFTLVL